MIEFFNNFDWNGFWLNVLVSSIFFILSIPLAIKFIPIYTIRQLNKKNKKFIARKISYVIQELCEYLNYSPYSDKELYKEKISIFTTKKDLKNYRFVGLLKINVFNKVNYPKIILMIVEHFKKLPIDEQFELIKKEKERVKDLREKLEKTIEIHSLHLNEKMISEISDLCLDIRSFEIKFKANFGIDDLIEKGIAERKGVFGILEIAKLNERFAVLLKELIQEKYFETEIE
jgi:hypothetical protein